MILNCKFAPSRETTRFLKDVAKLLDSRFDPILGYVVDDPTREIPLSYLIINGDPIKGYDNMHGMFTAILLVNQKVVSTHIFRIHGRGTQTTFAELPQGATEIGFEGKGYSQCLPACVEHVLEKIGVQLMVQPTTARAQPMWLQRFRFTKVARKQANFCTKKFNVLHFGNDLLQKTMSKSE